MSGRDAKEKEVVVNDIKECLTMFYLDAHLPFLTIQSPASANSSHTALQNSRIMRCKCSDWIAAFYKFAYLMFLSKVPIRPYALQPGLSGHKVEGSAHLS